MPVELPVEITPSFEEYQKAAEKWHRVFVKVPVLSAKDTTKYMTGLPGCRTNQHIGTAESKAQFYPYVANKRGNSNTKITFETLEIFFGSMIHDFVPNDEVQTILGENAAVMGDGMSKSEIAKLVIAGVMESAGEELALAIPTAVRQDNGDTTMDLFNGHVTVIESAITDGKVSVAKKATAHWEEFRPQRAILSPFWIPLFSKRMCIFSIFLATSWNCSVCPLKSVSASRFQLSIMLFWMSALKLGICSILVIDISSVLYFS